MNNPGPAPTAEEPATINTLPRHSLHHSKNATDFCSRFLAQTGRTIEEVVAAWVPAEMQRALFLTGTIPIQMATDTSDVDLIVLVDEWPPQERALPCAPANSTQQLAFTSATDPLLAVEFIALIDGVAIDVHVVVATAIKQLQQRLQGPGAMLGENDIKILSRLKTGWLLRASDNYLERNELQLSDRTLDLYCCARNLADADNLLAEALSACDRADMMLALHLGKSCVEKAYLAYFADGGYSWLGVRWLARIRHATGSGKLRQSELESHLNLLFPRAVTTANEIASYLTAVQSFLAIIRQHLEQTPASHPAP